LLDAPPNLERADSVVTDFTASIGYIGYWQSPSRNGYVTFAGSNATIGSIPSSPQPDTLVAVLNNIIRVVPINIYQAAPPPCNISVIRAVPTVEKTNANSTGGMVTFTMTVTPAVVPPLTSADIVISNGIVVAVYEPASGTGVYVVMVNTAGLGLTQSDTVQIDSVNVSPCGWTVPQSNQFFDIRKVFLDTLPTSSLCELQNQSIDGNGDIVFTENITAYNLSNSVFFTPNDGTVETNTTVSNNTITFDYSGLEPDARYYIGLNANAVKDDWGNPNSQLDSICWFETAELPCIDSIVRNMPTNYKTNVDTVTFAVYFNAPISGVSPSDFIIEGYEPPYNVPVDVSPATTPPSAVWYVKIKTINNDTNKAGVICKITDIATTAGFTWCDPTQNDSFNIRKEFLGNIDSFVVKYDNAMPGPGTVKIVFDEQLEGDGDVKDAYSGGQYVYIDDGTHYYLQLHFNYCPNINTTPYYVYFDMPHDKVVDLWGNEHHIGDHAQVTSQVFWKQTLSLAGVSVNPLEISAIKPNPAVDNASFTINTYQEGNLEVALYDLVGTKITTLLNTTAASNRQYDLNMRLGFLPNGIYTIFITLDDYKVSKSILINK
jgi:hypothetical protein